MTNQIANPDQNELELTHHGILGMKWGIRRTPSQLGNSSGSKRSKKKFAKKMQNAKKAKAKERAKINEEKETLEAKKKRVLSSRSAKEIYKNKDLFTYEELKDAYLILNTENNIKKLIPEEVSKGEHYINSAIKWGTKISDLASTGTKLYDNVSKINNIISNKKMPSGDTVNKAVNEVQKEAHKAKNKTDKQQAQTEKKQEKAQNKEADKFDAQMDKLNKATQEAQKAANKAESASNMASQSAQKATQAQEATIKGAQFVNEYGQWTLNKMREESSNSPTSNSVNNVYLLEDKHKK